MTGSNSTSIIEGMNPLKYNISNPVPLFLIQLSLIVCICRVVHLGMRYIGQPRVISEILGGILLGPTVLGRWTAFSNLVFPPQSLPFLSLVSSFGLILFLFLVGLELDPKTIKKNIKKSAAISISGIIIPFILGLAVSYILYKTFQNSGTFQVFMLFCGVSMSITAFPVLARVLSELRMIKTTVGSITITAASVDDVFAWCLLALVVALSKNGSGLSALWIFLTGVAYVLFVFFAIRLVYLKYLNHKGFLAGRDPSPQIVFITFLMVFLSAWFTDVLGIHAIFGAYIIGVIVPHQNGFAIKLAEKIEDLVSIFFLPIYFALSGLKTNLGVLNDWKAWLLLFLIVFVDLVGKIFGCSIAARFGKFTWRESLTIGVLMSCKGLVELIVLNIGLETKVINQDVFSILVLSALITTFTTTPVVKKIYPAKFYKYIEEEIPDDTVTIDHQSMSLKRRNTKLQPQYNTLIAVSRIQQLPSILTLVSLISKSKNVPHSPKNKSTTLDVIQERMHLLVLRLIEMTGRDSSIMRYAESDHIKRQDPVLTTFRAFSQVSDISSSLHLSVCNTDRFAERILEHAKINNADFVIVPAFGITSNTETQTQEKSGDVYENIGDNFYNTPVQLEIVKNIFTNSTIHAGVFINRGLSSVNFSDEPLDLSKFTKPKNSSFGKTSFGKDILQIPGFLEQTTDISDPNCTKPSLERFLSDGADISKPIILIPFFGGPDDRQALQLIIDLCGNTESNIQILHYIKNTNKSHANGSYKNYYLSKSPEHEAHLGTKSTSPLVDIKQSPVNDQNSPMIKLLSNRNDIELIESLLGIKLKGTLLYSEKVDESEFDTSKKFGNDENPKYSKNNDFDKAIDNNETFGASEFGFTSTTPKGAVEENTNDVVDNNKKTKKGITGSKKKGLIELPSFMNRHKKPNNDVDNTHVDSSEEKKNGEEHKINTDDIDENYEKAGGSNDKEINKISDSETGDKEGKEFEFGNISFTSTNYKNVTYKILHTKTPLQTFLNHALILRHSDLVVCGRNLGDSDMKTAHPSGFLDLIKKEKFNINHLYPNHLKDLVGDKTFSEFRVKDERRKVLGVIPERLLAMKSRASILVVQAYVDLSSRKSGSDMSLVGGNTA
ncbi:hypothetical protein BB559_004299 [Furculomyces boomerangus]|uniref:Cation/H+ exchanger transmembrane domain-containing protein n=1 Tax=Furculomyces boomerangus TaxID=61424 RepID=A0A2T9Y9E9_9FUNG|nr:hypothetical protein BB559_005307 [Furculomyces boomerangus]PVU91084.1 hypothetical protein BB559_004299 [Furculomyces boomerangus]